MAYPDKTTPRSYGGAVPPVYITSDIPAYYTDGQTITISNAAGWYEVDETGQATTIPLGTRGPFVIAVNLGKNNEEKILCSSINLADSFITVWTDGVLNGRGYDGTIISTHNRQITQNKTNDTFHVFGAVDFLQFNEGIIAALSGGGGGGSQGAQGPQGDPGGPQGYQGSQGAQGAQGQQGTQGHIGSQGFQGVRGYQGFQGAQGTGTQGPQGIPGTGTQGPQGASGTGSQGSQGAQGAQGESGTGGGAQGAQGNDGAQGTQGNDGNQGAQGNDGSQGPQGDFGPQGNDGSQGPQGNDGAQGTQGTAGASFPTYLAVINSPDGIATDGSFVEQTAAFTITGGPDAYVSPNRVTLIVSGGSCSYTGYISDVIPGVGTTTFQVYIDGYTGTNSGDQINWYMSLSGIQGNQGPQGNDGLQGAQGNDGSQGAQGNDGAQGATGDPGIYESADGVPPVNEDILWLDETVPGYAGPQGTQGVQGVQGARGYQGSVGAQGANGTNGSQGSQGLQGLQGSTGSQGSQGNAGSQGPQGTSGTNGSQGPQGSQGNQGNSFSTNDSGWIAVSSFTNSFVAGTAVAYRKLNGIVYLRGSVQSGTPASAAFTLPTGYRPSLGSVFAIQQYGLTTNNYVTVNTDGTVVPQTASAWLNNVVYPIG